MKEQFGLMIRVIAIREQMSWDSLKSNDIDINITYH